nr:MAG TPA: hypothetical protein [Caudoviricetes sp.]
MYSLNHQELLFVLIIYLMFFHIELKLSIEPQ